MSRKPETLRASRHSAFRGRWKGYGDNMGKFVDLTGQRFGRLVVLKRAENKGERPMWLCECECGNIKTVRGCDLKNGHTQSCGCLHKEVVTSILESNVNQNSHGKRRTRLYSIWCGVKTRCFNEGRKCFKDYGGRGITVCDEWRNSFEAFYEWAMANGYADNLTIDRIDVNGDYSPENCRWITLDQQQRNKRTTKKQG